MVLTLPTAYDDTSIQLWMLNELGDTASVLGWEIIVGSFERPLYAALRMYGISTVAAATDAGKLEAVARVAVWQAAVRGLASFYSYSDPASREDLSDLQKQALVALRSAEREAARHGVSTLTVRSYQVVREDDAYVTTATATEFGQ